MSKFIVEKNFVDFEPYEHHYEQEFEDHVLRSADVLFPRYIVVPWKGVINDVHGHTAKPDLVFISKTLDHWYVSEVEQATHRIYPNFRSQLEALSHGIYDRITADKLVAAFDGLLSESDVRTVTRSKPGFVCIADLYTEVMADICRGYDFEYCVLLPYHSDIGGWGLQIRQISDTLGMAEAIGQYGLRIDREWGDQTVVGLPLHFPSEHTELRLRFPDGTIRKYPIYPQLTKTPSILIDSSLVRELSSTVIQPIDPNAALYEIVKEN